MKAQLLTKIAPVEDRPLEAADLPLPEPGPEQVRVQISVCGVCHTELDEIEGRLPPKLPIVLGHQVVGRVHKAGAAVRQLHAGDRVGVAWIYSACGICAFCRAGHENLLPLAAAIPIIPEVEEYPLEQANETLARLKAGQIHGAAVLRISA